MKICEAFHELVREEPELFFMYLKFIGNQDDGEGGLLALGNCSVCKTTLAVPLPLCAAPGAWEVSGDDVTFT